MIAQLDRDARGRFVPGNGASSAGGRARAAKLSQRRRSSIARRGFKAMVNKHFHGDVRAAKARWSAIGRYNYERMAGTFEPGSPLRTNARHPGTIQEFLCVYW